MPGKSPLAIERKFQRALTSHKQGNLAEARKGYRAVLKVDAKHPGALHFLGVIFHRQGDSEQGMRLIRSAIEHAPDDGDAHKNLGNILVEASRFVEAETCYQRAITQQPGEATNYANLCVVLRHLERFDDAIKAGRKSVKLAPGNALGWYSLGNAYKNAKKLRMAIKCYEKTVALSQNFAPAWDSLCQVTFSLEKRSRLGRRSLKRTTSAYERWLANDPGNNIATFMLSALRGEIDLERAPDDFVRDMFDQFSGTFEQRLDQLEYRVPGLVAAILDELPVNVEGKLDVLDGGCGTGLCGPFLKPYAAHLTGVDLSSGMLAKARGTGLYDNLVESELTSWLSNHPGEYDLAVFADTLCYFGDLEQLTAATVRALRPGGRSIFSLEHFALEDDPRGYRLDPHGRYSHTRQYAMQILIDCGFEILEIRVETLRLEKGYPVSGLIVSAKKR